MKRRWLAVWLCALLLIGSIGVCRADGPGVSAAAAVLLDADTGEILYEKKAQQQMLIASTTKIMTAVVALECAPLQKEVEITQNHMVEGSSMYLAPGERVTVEELLYGLMLCSGNDAALALAEGCCGNVDTFVDRMNRKAEELGLTGTSFANPNGLDDANHYSTALDMARLASCAVQNPAFVRLCSTIQAATAERTMSNHNKLLRSLEGCVGLKTGYTMAAGRTLVTCVIRDGRTLVAVTLQDGNDWADHEAMYDYGFAAAT